MSLLDLLTIRGLDDRPLFRVREVCALLNVTRMTVSRWVRAGQLTALRINGKTRWITRASLAALVAQEAL